MSRPRLVLFDDDVARTWRPFTLTRPAGELLFGTRTLRDRAEHALGLQCVGHVSSAELQDYDEPWAPPVLPSADVAQGGAGGGDTADIVLLSSRFVAEPADLPDRPALLVSGERVVGCRVAEGTRLPEDFFHDPDAAPPNLPRHELPGRLLDRVWELMSGSPDQVARDLDSTPPAEAPAGVHVVGDGGVSLGRGVEIAPGVVLDTRDGPIRLADGVEVRPFTSITGPAWVGQRSVLLGGPYEHVAIGPVCKVHGEVEATVILGYSNKAHTGFLGHAYLGMWVNLGALTTNSDLKNNYGNVRVWTPTGDADTGERKIGSFLGDHVKTAIGTMLNTGTVIEAASNIFGGMPPKYVRPFSWGGGEAEYDVERFLETAEVVMGRRDVELTDRQRSLLRTAFRTTRD